MGRAHEAAPLELWLRSCAFNTGLLIFTLIASPLAALLFPLPYRLRYRVVSIWVACNLWWLAKTCRLRHRIEGRENVPPYPAIVLSKHSSAWETLALNLVFQPQVWVLKRELLRIPFFGWGLAALKPIAIDRRAGASAIEQVRRQGLERLRSGCWVVVFPEGTRVAPGTRRRYRLGGARLAAHAAFPIVPVAHNAGDYWPRNSFVKRPGTIRLVIGPPIAPEGRTAHQINALAEEWIEGTVSRIRTEDGKEEGSKEVALERSDAPI